MSYVQHSMLPGENVRFLGHVHWWICAKPLFIIALGFVFLLAAGYLLEPLVFFLVMGAGCLLVGIFKLIAAITYMRTTELAVTDRRVIGKWGFIQRDTIEQRLEKVDSTIVHQSMFGRLMDFGDIVVHGSGTTQTPIRMIVNPLSFRKAVDVGTAAFESRRTDTFSLQAN